jgi:hypothetical protein
VRIRNAVEEKAGKPFEPLKTGAQRGEAAGSHRPQHALPIYHCKLAETSSFTNQETGEQWPLKGSW